MTFKTLRLKDETKASWNDMQVDFWRISTAHSQYLAVKAFYDNLKSERTANALDAQARDILWALFRLYSICIIETTAHDFYASLALDVQQVEDAIRVTKPALLKQLRPHAVPLVDAWNLPDWFLDSSLGRYDGRVYEDLFHRASQLNPLNRIVPDVGFERIAQSATAGLRPDVRSRL